MADAKRCDACGRYYEHTPEVPQFKILIREEMVLLDLCQECEQKIYSIIFTRKVTASLDDKMRKKQEALQMGDYIVKKKEVTDPEEIAKIQKRREYGRKYYQEHKESFNQQRRSMRRSDREQEVEKKYGDPTPWQEHKTKQQKHFEELEAQKEHNNAYMQKVREELSDKKLEKTFCVWCGVETADGDLCVECKKLSKPTVLRER